ncbi:MAG: hypothetical protein K0S51_537 [Bacillales bacterium]|jgi:hypothetical protein|nr:hypothetical protein [Bacillales bacterium]
MNLKNEKGNALIIVLLLITVFSILYMSIIGFTFNNAKQINRTEERFQAVSLAEMGVEYYRTAINAIVGSYTMSDNLKEAIQEKYKSRTLNETINLTATNDKEIFERLALEIESELSSKLPLVEKSISVDSISKSSYTIMNDTYSHELDADKNAFNIQYRFTSRGKSIDKTINLNAKIDIPLTSITFKLLPASDNGSGGSGGSGSGEWIPIVTFNNIPDPGNLELCSSTLKDFDNVDCQSAFFPSDSNEKFLNTTLKVLNDATFSKNINSIENTTLYFSKDLTANGNINNPKNMNLHVAGDAVFNDNINNSNNSILEIGGNATFAHSFDASNSKIYIGGSANFKNINSTDNSTIYMGSNSVIDGNLNFGSNNKICVNGDLTIKSNVNSVGSNTQIIVKGTLTIEQNLNTLGTNSKISTDGSLIMGDKSNINANKSQIFATSSNQADNVTIKSSPSFESECGSYSTPNSTVNIEGQYVGTPTMSASYQYNY